MGHQTLSGPGVMILIMRSLFEPVCPPVATNFQVDRCSAEKVPVKIPIRVEDETGDVAVVHNAIPL